MRAASPIVIHRAEWAATRGSVLLIALGIFENVQPIKDIGFRLIAVSAVIDILTKRKRYLCFIVNTRDRLLRRG